MTQYRYSRSSGPSTDPVNNIGGLIIMAVIIVGLFVLANFIFRILYYLSPVFLIAALILDYRTVIDYGKSLVNLTKKNLLWGIGAIVLTLLGFPLVMTFLFGKALLKRNARKYREEMRRQHEGELTDYEEVDEEQLRLPKVEKRKKTKTKIEIREKRNDYDDLFE